MASDDSTMLLRVEHSPVVIHRYNRVAFDVGEPAIIKCRMQVRLFLISIGYIRCINSCFIENPVMYLVFTLYFLHL